MEGEEGKEGNLHGKKREKEAERYNSFLAQFTGCSPGRPIDTILAAAGGAAAKLKAKGTADHPRIAKLLGDVKRVQKEKEIRRVLEYTLRCIGPGR